MTPALSPAISLRDVTLGYDQHPAVHHLSGQIAQGSLIAVVGPNGAGKSTLLKGVVGMLKPIGGAIDVAAAAIAYLPQAAEVDRSFPLSVYEFVALGCWRGFGVFGGVSARQRERIADALQRVGLSGFEARGIGTLSGGQMQRALFARLLLQDAPLVLLDEPFSAIDQRTTHDMIDLVRQWHGEGRTIVAVLHDLALVHDVFPEALLLAREPVAWGATADVLTANNLLTARRMVEAFDDHADVCERAA